MTIPTTTNKAMQGAYRRGKEARAAGQARSSCPYKVAPYGCYRRHGGTFGAVFLKYWVDGWWDEDERLRINAEVAAR